jgi:hypothetical protein
MMIRISRARPMKIHESPPGPALGIRSPGSLRRPVTRMSDRLERVLGVLRAAGRNGIVESELARASGVHAASMVVSELRQRWGYRISASSSGRPAKGMGRWDWRYVLEGGAD